MAAFSTQRPATLQRCARDAKVNEMQPRRDHAVVAVLSAFGAVITAGLTAMAGDPRSPGTLLAIVLLANAFVRFRLASR